MAGPTEQHSAPGSRWVTFSMVDAATWLKCDMDVKAGRVQNVMKSSATWNEVSGEICCWPAQWEKCYWKAESSW